MRACVKLDCFNFGFACETDLGDSFPSVCVYIVMAVTSCLVFLENPPRKSHGLLTGLHFHLLSAGTPLMLDCRVCPLCIIAVMARNTFPSTKGIPIPPVFLPPFLLYLFSRFYGFLSPPPINSGEGCLSSVCSICFFIAFFFGVSKKKMKPPSPVGNQRGRYWEDEPTSVTTGRRRSGYWTEISMIMGGLRSLLTCV